MLNLYFQVLLTIWKKYEIQCKKINNSGLPWLAIQMGRSYADFPLE